MGGLWMDVRESAHSDSSAFLRVTRASAPSYFDSEEIRQNNREVHPAPAEDHETGEPSGLLFYIYIFL